MQLLTILLIAAVTFSITALDRLLYKSNITPMYILSIPYASIAIATIIFSPLLGFYEVSPESVIVWMFGLLIFELGSILVWIATKLKNYNFFSYRTQQKEFRSDFLLMILAWFLIFVNCYGLRYAVAKVGGVTGIISDEFQEIYGYGWIAHARSVSVPLLIYLIGTVGKKDIFRLITIAAFMSFLLVYQVKGWLMLPLISGILYRIWNGRLKLSLLNLFTFLISSSLIFILVYLVGNIARNFEEAAGIDNLIFLLQHLVFYMFSGILGFSEAIKHATNYPDDTLKLIINPFINIFNMLFSGKTSSYVTEYFNDVGNGYASNVHTFFGTIYLFCGNFFGFCYILTISVVSYLAYLSAFRTRNCWIVIAYIFFVSGFALGWFEFYYWNIAFLEVPFAAFLYAIFFKVSESLSTKLTIFNRN